MKAQGLGIDVGNGFTAGRGVWRRSHVPSPSICLTGAIMHGSGAGRREFVPHVFSVRETALDPVERDKRRLQRGGWPSNLAVQVCLNLLGTTSLDVKTLAKLRFEWWA
jgi:hypothetical protein